MSNSVSTQCLNIPTYALLMAKLRKGLATATSGIKSIKFIKPYLIFEMNDGSEIKVELPLDVINYVTKAELDALNPTVNKNEFYVVDYKDLYVCDGTQFIKINSDVESLTVDEQDVIIKKCVGDYYISTATKLTQNDLMNITAKNNYLSTSDLNTFMQMLK